MCTLPWCNTYFKGRCVKQGALPSLGSVGLSQVPDEHKADLQAWLKDILCTNMDEASRNTCVESRNRPPWSSKRIGRWHFDEAMLKKWKGGTIVLDWDSKTKPYPIKSWHDLEHLVVKSPPTAPERVEKRDRDQIVAAVGEDSTALKVMANVSKKAAEAEAENERLRALLVAAQKYMLEMKKLSADAAARVAELKEDRGSAGSDGDARREERCVAVT